MDLPLSQTADVSPGKPDERTLYRSMFSASPDALLLVDRDGGIALANPAAAGLLGYTVQELCGLNVDALVPETVRLRHATYRAGYAVNPRSRPMGMQMELVALRRDGTEVRVEIALSPLQSHGLPYVLAAIRDVGAYPRVRQALQRARYSESVAQFGRLAVDTRDPRRLLQRVPLAAVQALEADSAAVLLLEADGRQVQLAGAFGRVCAFGGGDGESFAPDTETQHVLDAVEALVVDDYVQERRFAVPPRRLASGLASALLVPLLDRGRAIGLLAAHACDPGRFGDDELHFLQALASLLASSLQRAQSEEALLHAQRLESVGQLTGGIAHDFNNLLTVIHGNLQVLEELPTLAGDGYAQQLVASALRASRRGAELTGKLLAFSSRQVLQPREVDVGQLLASLADMLRRTLEQHIAIELDAVPVPQVLADPGQLEAALLNLAINARDAMPKGGQLRFVCRTAQSLPVQAARGPGVGDAVDGYVAIAVSDTGVGMSESVRDRAFEPFFTTKAPGRGTGLGLSTVYGFAIQSSGAVQLDSAPGAGTTVTLYIPCAVTTPAHLTSNTPSTPQPLPLGLRVLLVEDDAQVREVVRNFLSSLGCCTTVCASGEQALALDPVATRFDLLVSDVALGPGMRGTELANLASARWNGMAVVLMSGYSSDLLAVHNGVQPAWPLLRKPCSRDELAAALVQALQQP